MEFVGARVAGESVRVDAGQAHTLLVPLLKTRPGELSYDVELVYRRPAPGTPGDRPLRTWGRWQLDDPKLPGIPVEKTLWDVFLPADAQLLSSGGNVEPVVAALNETEKLESELVDLRSLSATYQSTNATRQEQRLALNNFNALAADVKSKAQRGDDRRRAPVENAAAALFKPLDATSQSAMVSRKQRLIQNELDSLSTANVVAQQAPVAVGGSLAGHIDYGSPIPTLSGHFSTSLQGQENWRDNRSLDQNRTRAFGSKAQTDSGTVTAGNTKLALNDSVTVDLPATPFPAKSGEAKKELSRDGDGLDRSRLSTARATEKAALPEVASAPATEEIGARQLILRESPAVPGSPASPAAPDTGAGTRTETLRATGRVSLAVNFPQTGQVYHFKKLKADAHLTLWSVRPAAFERLEWLLVLAALIALGTLARRMATRRA